MKELIIFGIGFFGGFLIACILAASKLGAIQEWYWRQLKELEVKEFKDDPRR